MKCVVKCISQPKNKTKRKKNKNNKNINHNLQICNFVFNNKKSRYKQLGWGIENYPQSIRYMPNMFYVTYHFPMKGKLRKCFFA